MGKSRNGRRKKLQRSTTPSDDDDGGDDRSQNASLLIDIDPPALPPPSPLPRAERVAAFDEPLGDYGGSENPYGDGDDEIPDDGAWLAEGQKDGAIDVHTTGPLAAHVMEPILTEPPAPSLQDVGHLFEHAPPDPHEASPLETVRARGSRASQAFDPSTIYAADDDDAKEGQGVIRAPDEMPSVAAKVPSADISGHTSAPVISRHPTRLESLSKAVSNYVPSSIAISIPSAALSPPRVSRPVSFGRFMTPSNECAHTASAEQRRRSWGSDAGLKTLEEALDLENLDGGTPTSNLMRYPSGGSESTERVTWAHWDTLVAPPGGKARRLLVLGYASGMQVWDCTNLDALRELLNLPDAPWGRIWHAAVLPTPLEDTFAHLRPFLGIVSKRVSRDPEFLIYSLQSHAVVKRTLVPGLVSFSASNRFIILSTVNPPSLHIVSASTFTTLRIIPTSSLIPFGRRRPPAASHPTDHQHDNASEDVTDPDAPPDEYEPRPVFALSGRLLAISSPPLRDAYAAVGREPASTSATGIPGVDVVAGLAQADIGTAARRVGSSVLSGVRALGGLAMSVARTRLSGDPLPPSSPHDLVASPVSTTSARPFASRSAPAPTGIRAADISDDARAVPPADLLDAPESSATFVTVLDLMPLLDDEPAFERAAEAPRPGSPPRTLRPSQISIALEAQPETVTAFALARGGHICALAFSADGTHVFVVPEGGQTVHEYAIRPIPRARRRNVADDVDADVAIAEKSGPWHVYDLRRGRTHAIIDSVDVAADGRWVALGSRKRTVHVFATNPYGGPPDEQSHMSGRVSNALTLQPAPTTLAPIVRVRVAQQSQSSALAPPPLAVAFVAAPFGSMPKRLLPSATVQSPPSSGAGSVASSPSPEPRSPVARRRPSNFQDILLFDPLSGALSLRRFFVEQRQQSESSLSVPNGVPGIGGTSISLPSRPTFGLANPAPSTGRVSALSAMMERPAELYARESEIATWNLRRARDWDAFRGSVRDTALSKVLEPKGKVNWVWQAELQTSSPSRQILPRPIYLSHQFAFFSLEGDYQGFVRQHRLDVAGPRISVRQEVTVNAHASGVGDVPFTQDVGPESFDESLSSAMSSSLEVGAGSPAIIPMYPNGGTSSSYKRTFPMVRVAEGVSDSLARVRREIGKVRSPKMAPRADRGDGGMSVPLEFDEERDEFLLGDGAFDQDAGRTGWDERLQETVHTGRLPRESGAHPDSSSGTDPRSSDSLEGRGDLQPERASPGNAWTADDDESWPSWEHAVAEAEPFDEISAVGFMDEEQEAQKVAVREGTGTVRKKRRRGGKILAS